MTDPPPPSQSTKKKKKRALRYVEARRTGTCAFADRIAALSLQHYRQHILEEEEEPAAASTRKPTCLATIIAAFATDQIQGEGEGQQGEKQTQQQLLLCAMGVGTKFLSQEMLTAEISMTENDDDNHHHIYGTRIRDAHAEVLVRRAFQRYLGICIEQMEEKEARATDHSTTTITSTATTIPVSPLYSILEPSNDDDNGETPVLYRLRPNVTLHMYCSSTPCGNSTIKKFATLHKETYDAALSAHEWPRQEHPPIPLHSIPLGQCALLLKRDRQRSNEEEASSTKTTTTTDETLRSTSHPAHKKERSTWPLYSTTDWCPPGTTPTWSGQGACHSCSDKLARWNCLGLQGAWLSSLLSSPLYLTTLTVGRKFSQHTCRRAVCCRLQRPKPPRRGDTTSSGDSYTLHHVVVMGTGVYMDEDGVHDWSAALEEGMTTTAVRFHSSRSFCSWLRPDTSPTPQYTVECIDGSTGRLYGAPDVAVAEYDADRGRSLVSSAALMELYWRIQTRRSRSFPPRPRTLTQVRRRKRLLAPAYERAKRQLLTRHPVMREWQRRRVDSIDDDDDNHAPLVLDAAAVRVENDD